MIRIQLTPREIQLFEKIAILGRYAIKYEIREHDIIVSDDVINLEQITFMIVDYFCSKGLMMNSEPNALGMELEKLNTKFIIQLQILNDSLMRI